MPEVVGPLGSSVVAGGPPRPTSVKPVPLAAIASRHGATLSGGDAAITGVTSASDWVRPGDLFAAVPGRTTHGARYADIAVRAGAAAVLTDASGAAHVPPGVPVLEVGDVRAALGPISAEVYGRPSQSLDVIGITGTSGKTTTSFLARAGLQAAGITTGLIGTVATFLGEQAVKVGFTTPEAPEIQALLADMVERGARFVVMEVSSHALSMRRADGIGFALAAFTNLSQDHLDYHTDMDDYFAAKARLFDGRARSAVVVTEDEWGRRLAAGLGTDTITVNGAGGPAAWRAVDVSVDDAGRTSFRALGPAVDIVAATCIPGRYNVTNALLALAILDHVGVPAEVAAPAIATATVPGRMERIDAGQPFLAVVDYSHKPAAVDGAIRGLRPLTRGRLIVVLGCGGDRDRAKRPLMGEVAARGADVLIITDDNPRSEDPAAIRQEMLAGARNVPDGERGAVVEVADRGAAIETAVATAAVGDTVLIAGKGHETGQEVGGMIYPFDDRAVLRHALRSLGMDE